MHILIVGLGKSGQAVYDFCSKRGDKITVYDDRLAPSPIDLNAIELVIKSPGVPYSHPLMKKIQAEGIPVIGEIDLALMELKGKNLLAITGSNGKTTTTHLAVHLLQMSGKKAIAAGNVGVPLVSLVNADVDTYVVELSSFQLESIVLQPVFDGAVLLNLTPNHLDRHETFEEYAKAKLRLRYCLKQGAPFFLSESVASQFFLSGTIFKVKNFPDLRYRDRELYPHERENISAAQVLTGVDDDLLKKGMETFSPLPHRLEFVRKFKGISFFNDSKATSVDALEKAVKALSSNIILIAGGVDKGGDFSHLVSLFQQKVKKAFLIGEAANRIHRELHAEIEVEKTASLEEGIKKAMEIAKSGDTVLLSPGCSSYDQFSDYKHRGETFKKMVCALEEILP